MKRLKAIWELMRLEHGVMLALGIFIGSLIALQSHGTLSLDTFPWKQFVLTFCTALFLEASTFALNDYYDFDIDKKNNRIDRPLVRGDVHPRTALYLFYLFFPLGILCSYFVNVTCFLIALITALFAIVYDVFLKKIKLLSNFYIAYVMAIPFVFGAAAIENTNLGIHPAVLMVALIAFLAGSGREIMKDVMDFEGDTASGVKSFPRYIGIRSSQSLAALFYVLAVCLSVFPYLFIQFGIYHLNAVYLLFIVATDIVFLITSVQLLGNPHIPMAFYRKLTLLGLFLGLLAFFLGAFIG